MKFKVYYPRLNFDLKQFNRDVIRGILECGQRSIIEGDEDYLCIFLQDMHRTDEIMEHLSTVLTDSEFEQLTFDDLANHITHILEVIEKGMRILGHDGTMTYTSDAIANQGVAGWLMHQNLFSACPIYPSHHVGPDPDDEGDSDDALDVFWDAMLNQHNLGMFGYRENWLAHIIKGLEK